MLPKPTIQTLNGWLSPEGMLYPCHSGGHHALSELLITKAHGTINPDIDPQRILEKLGWAKLASDRELPVSLWMGHRRGSGDITWDPDELTNAQFTTVIEWHELYQRKTTLSERIKKWAQQRAEPPISQIPCAITC